MRGKYDTDYLWEHFCVTPEGKFLRKYRNGGWYECQPSETSGGYLRFGLPNNKTITAHRLAWFLRFGYIPSLEIDHIDGDRKNNSLSNLRLVDKQQNQSNRLPNVKSKSKYKGVFKGYKDKWIASLSFKKTRHYLGQFNCETSAAIAYNKKAAELKDNYRRLN